MSARPIIPEEPVMKVTVYLKSGAVVTFPGRADRSHNGIGFSTVGGMEIPFVDLGAVEMIIQGPWTEET